MIVFGLIPNGLYQFVESFNHGTRYARSAEVMHSPWMQWTVWLRIPGDVIFTIGALAMIAFVVKAIWAVLPQPTQNQLQLTEIQELTPL